MDDLPVSLEDLIARIENRDKDPLQLLTDAVIFSGNLARLGDDLVDHFVQQARESGASWADIGQSMGVSKQAAQKRFVSSRRPGSRMAGGGLFTRFTPRARETVERAVGHAHRLHSAEINTVHLVMSLVEPESGPAAAAVGALADSPDQIVAVAEEAVAGPSPSKKARHLPFAKDAKKVLELSLREAIRSESRRIGTEHILLGLLRDNGSSGSVLLADHGVTYPAVESWVEENPVSDR